MFVRRDKTNPEYIPSLPVPFNLYHYNREDDELSSDDSDEDSQPTPPTPPEKFTFDSPKRLLRLPPSEREFDPNDPKERLAVLDIQGLHLFNTRGYHVRTILKKEAKDICGNGS